MADSTFMADSTLIRIKRHAGDTKVDTTKTLQAGEPFIDFATGKFYIGTNDDVEIGDLIPINSNNYSKITLVNGATTTEIVPSSQEDNLTLKQDNKVKFHKTEPNTIEFYHEIIASDDISASTATVSLYKIRTGDSGHVEKSEVVTRNDLTEILNSDSDTTTINASVLNVAKTPTVSSDILPIYIDDNTIKTALKYAGGTKINLNGDGKGATDATIFAPTSAGVAEQLLFANPNGEPNWTDKGEVVGKCGSSTQPVYFNENGRAQAITNTIESNVPQNAKFTAITASGDTFLDNSTIDLTGDGNHVFVSKTDENKITVGLSEIFSSTATYGLTSSITATYGGSFTVPCVSVDKNGIVTSATDSIVTLPATENQTIACGTATFGVNATINLLGDNNHISVSKTAGNKITVGLKKITNLAGEYGPTSDPKPKYGESFTVPYIYVDNNGIVTSAINRTVTLPSTENQTIKCNGATFGVNASIDFKAGKNVALTAAGTTITISSANTNTHRPIQLDGTQILGDNTTPLNLKPGNNVTLANSNGAVTITATDTTYQPVSEAHQEDGLMSTTTYLDIKNLKDTVSTLPNNLGTSLAANKKSVTLYSANGTALSTITTQDTTYDRATSTQDGLMSKLDKTLLDSVPQILLDMFYPVGSIFMTTNTTNPDLSTAKKVQKYFKDKFNIESEWEEWCAGRFPVGYDGSSSLYNTVNTTGGSADACLVAHKHIFTGSRRNTEYAGSHTHDGSNVTIYLKSSLNRRILDGGSGTYYWVNGEEKSIGLYISTSGSHKHEFITNGTISEVGEDNTNKNLPPYQVCYMWRRIK